MERGGQLRNEFGRGGIEIDFVGKKHELLEF
jgi:hypothetical protein